jgi:hypothetical protein
VTGVSDSRVTDCIHISAINVTFPLHSLPFLNGLLNRETHQRPGSALAQAHNQEAAIISGQISQCSDRTVKNSLARHPNLRDQDIATVDTKSSIQTQETK